MSFNTRDWKGFTFRSGPAKKTTKQNSHFWMNDNDTNVVDVDDDDKSDDGNDGDDERSRRRRESLDCTP